MSAPLALHVHAGSEWNLCLFATLLADFLRPSSIQVYKWVKYKRLSNSVKDQLNKVYWNYVNDLTASLTHSLLEILPKNVF